MSKKVVAKSIAMVVFGLIFLVGAVFTTIYLCSDGRDYTEEYSVYKQVKDVKMLDDARNKLQSLNIEYKIKDKTLSLENFSHISFAISEDGSCLINSNKNMKIFEKLEDEDLSVVTVSGITQDSKIVEKFTIYRMPRRYTKLNNHYFMLLTGPFLAVCGGAYIIGGLLLIYGAIDLCSLRSKAKKT